MKLADDDLLKKIGAELKKMRVEEGYTSYENFALDNDIDRKYYWSIEKGRNISILYLKRILDIYEMSFNEFFSKID